MSRSSTFDRWLTTEPEPDEETCPACDGDGKYFVELDLTMQTCHKCGGTGTVPRSDEHPDPDAAYELRGNR